MEEFNREDDFITFTELMRQTIKKYFSNLFYRGFSLEKLPTGRRRAYSVTFNYMLFGSSYLDIQDRIDQYLLER